MYNTAISDRYNFSIFFFAQAYFRSRRCACYVRRRYESATLWNAPASRKSPHIITPKEQQRRPGTYCGKIRINLVNRFSLCFSFADESLHRVYRSRCSRLLSEATNNITPLSICTFVKKKERKWNWFTEADHTPRKLGPNLDQRDS